MSLNPVGTKRSYSWNYSNPNKPNYSQSIVGTVVAIQQVQAREYTGNGQPGAPKFWKDSGRPIMNIRIALATQNGDLVSFTFMPATNKQKEGDYGVHMKLWHLTGDTDMSNLIGKTIEISTQEPGVNPNTGQPMRYGSGNPRPFDAKIVDAGPFTLNQQLPPEFEIPELMCDDAVSGGQMQPGVAPQNIQVPNAQPPIQGGFYAPPTPQPVQQVQPIQAQPVNVQPMQVAAQTVPAQTMPAGMDPQVAAAMQAMGANNAQDVTPQNDGGAVYDEGIPF